MIFFIKFPELFGIIWQLLIAIKTKEGFDTIFIIPPNFTISRMYIQEKYITTLFAFKVTIQLLLQHFNFKVSFKYKEITDF